jgi:hypothetical protein
MENFFRNTLAQTLSGVFMKRAACRLFLLAMLLGLCAQSSAESLLANFYTNPGNLDRVKTFVQEEKTPDEELLLTEFLEIPTKRAPFYGTFIQGLLVPPETGTYYFYIAADNDGQFYLSSDARAENLGAEPACIIDGNNPSASRKYNAYPTQKSAAVELTAGSEYYFEIYHYDFGYTSNLSIAWATPSMGDVVPSLPIEVQYTKVYSAPSKPPRIVTQPVSQNFWEGDPLSLSVSALGALPLSYQWFREGVEIAGATHALYSLSAVSTEDAGSYTVEVRNEIGSVTSEAALVEVRSTGNLVQAHFYDNLTSLAQLKTRIAEGVPYDERGLLEEYLEVPLNRAVNFGTLIRGMILPPETGTYYFYVSADNDGQFYLSSDSSRENLSAEPICVVVGHNCTTSRVYNKYPTQKSAAIELTAGKAYYFEGYQCDYGYDSNYSVAWATPSMGDVVPSLPIEAQFLAPFRALTPTLSYTWISGELELTFTGTLQSYDPEEDLWTDVATEGNSYRVVLDQKARLFRARN